MEGKDMALVESTGTSNEIKEQYEKFEGLLQNKNRR